MSLASCLSWTFSRSHALHGPRRNPAVRPKKARLFLEQLEGRALLASYSAASVSALIADITAANTAGGANTITLTAPTTSPYVLTAVNNTDATAADGLPVIAANDNLTIVGNGDTIERSTAAGTPDFRLLEVAREGSLTLENLTLQGGFCVGGGRKSGGGAIFSQGTLVLNGVTVQGNTITEFACGGGIFSNLGSVTLEGGTIVQNNVASGTLGYGGGLYAVGCTVTVSNATVDNNIAEGGEAAYGGGLCLMASTVTVMSNATVDKNVAEVGEYVPRGGRAVHRWRHCNPLQRHGRIQHVGLWRRTVRRWRHCDPDQRHDRVQFVKQLRRRAGRR